MLREPLARGSGRVRTCDKERLITRDVVRNVALRFYTFERHHQKMNYQKLAERYL